MIAQYLGGQGLSHEVSDRAVTSGVEVRRVDDELAIEHLGVQVYGAEERNCQHDDVR